TSIIDYFADQAYGSTTAQFDQNASQYNTPTGLAYFNYLIGPLSITDPNKTNDVYFSDVQGKPDQREEIETKGAANQWSFSYGANIKDMFFFGAGLGVTSLRYSSKKVYTENFADDPNFKDLTLEENL